MIRLIAIVLALMLAGCGLPRSEPMLTGGTVPQPGGHVAYCQASPEACKIPLPRSDKIPLTHATMSTFTKTNYAVNDYVQYKAEAVDVWHTAENGHGGCEDIALRKQKHLREIYPAFAAAFRVALLWDETGGGHAVLLVNTPTGMLVLDSRFPQVAPWRQLPYRWYGMENPGHDKWISIKQ